MQDTIRAPNEAKTLKKASLVSIAITSAFYMAIGTIGYAAFGDNAPGNLLTGMPEPQLPGPTNSCPSLAALRTCIGQGGVQHGGSCSTLVSSQSGTSPSAQPVHELWPAGFGFYKPYWLVIIANLAIVIHLIGGYQVWTQPFLMAVESKVEQLFPNSRFLKAGFNVPAGRNKVWHVRYYILVWRSMYVVFTTIIAILAPFFNDIVGAHTL